MELTKTSETHQGVCSLTNETCMFAAKSPALQLLACCGSWSSRPTRPLIQAESYPQGYKCAVTTVSVSYSIETRRYGSVNWGLILDST